MKTASRKTVFQTGFTLLELLVAAVLISIVLAISIPNLQPLFYNDPLRKSARLFAAVAAEAREQALESEGGTILAVDISGGSLAITSPSRRIDQSGAETKEPSILQFPDSVSIDSVWTLSSGPVSSGQASIYINRRGMIEPVVINFSEAARVIVVEGAPFRGDVQVFDQPLPLPSSVAVLSATAE